MFKLLNKKKNNKGFTLVELVIVIAILAILVGILAPQYTKYVEKSRKAADASNMDEMVKVVKVFAADPANELAADNYVITMTHNSGTNLSVADGTPLDNEMDASRRSPSSDRRYVIYTVRNCIAGRGNRLCDYYRISRGSGPVGRQW